MSGRVLAFIQANPGCTLTPIVHGVDGIDAADAWNAIHDLERQGLVIQDRPDGSKWQFWPVAS